MLFLEIFVGVLAMSVIVHLLTALAVRAGYAEKSRSPVYHWTVSFIGFPASVATLFFLERVSNSWLLGGILALLVVWLSVYVAGRIMVSQSKDLASR